MSQYSNYSGNSLRDRSIRNIQNFNNNYELIERSDTEITRDEYLEAIENDNQLKEEYNKSNLFKSRIIGIYH